MFYWNWFKKEVKYFFLDHKVSRFVLTNSYTLIFCIISALCFGIGFRSFISLNETLYVGQKVILRLATGGMSGASQCVILVLDLCGITMNYNTLQSIFYFSLNVPILIFSFIKLGPKFSIFTSLNVVFTSLFISILPAEFFDNIAQLVSDQPLARAIFAGLCTGLSSAFAFKSGHSTGGIDVIAYYYSLRKSTSTGKYIAFMNGILIITFTFLTILDGRFGNGSSTYAEAIITACFSIVYLFISSLVVDSINVRNKKVQLQIITSNEELSRIILANVPHSCTIVKAKGAYTGSEKFILYVVVSNNEVTKLISQIRHVDENSFISAINLNQVYGRFFINKTK